MRKVFRVLGWIFLSMGVVLVVVGLLCLPAGGLMFALPYVFFLPGTAALALGALLILLTRNRQAKSPAAKAQMS